MRFAAFTCLALAFALVPALGPAFGPAFGQDNFFAEGPGGSVVHTSGYVCPPKVASFERDAAGLRDPETGAAYCAYSALSGVYGTIIILPLTAEYDAKTVLAPEFLLQEGTGAHKTGDQVQMIGQAGAALLVHVRIYETARLETRRYRTLYASAPIGGWVVAAIVEYSDPADKDLNTAFLNAVYSEAVKDIGLVPGQ